MPPALLMALAGMLTVLGTLLLIHPSARTAQGSAPQGSSRSFATSTPAGSREPARSPSAAASPVPSSSGTNRALPMGGKSRIPIPGDGPGADQAVQNLLQRSTPANLPQQQERELLDLGEHVWRADVTGQGRAQWPAYFPDAAPPPTPYTRIRLQAAIARALGNGQAEVRLVWAGTGPSGQQADGRTTRLLFAGTAHGWEPVR